MLQTRDILGLFLFPLALLLAAWVIHAFQLWDFLANMTLPWLCTAIAVSVILLGTVCVVLQVPPAGVPTRVGVMVVAGTLVIFGFGMIIDANTYPTPSDTGASVGGWIGFAIVLAGVFALPRMRPAREADRQENRGNVSTSHE